MTDRPEDIALKVELLLDERLLPEDWAEAKKIERDFAAAMDHGGSLEAVAINLEHLLRLRRLQGHANPNMDAKMMQEADESTREVLFRVIRLARRQSGDDNPRPDPPAK